MQILVFTILAMAIWIDNIASGAGGLYPREMFGLL